MIPCSAVAFSGVRRARAARTTRSEVSAIGGGGGGAPSAMAAAIARSRHRRLRQLEKRRFVQLRRTAGIATSTARPSGVLTCRSPSRAPSGTVARSPDRGHRACEPRCAAARRHADVVTPTWGSHDRRRELQLDTQASRLQQTPRRRITPSAALPIDRAMARPSRNHRSTSLAQARNRRAHPKPPRVSVAPCSDCQLHLSSGLMKPPRRVFVASLRAPRRPASRPNPRKNSRLSSAPRRCAAAARSPLRRHSPPPPSRAAVAVSAHHGVWARRVRAQLAEERRGLSLQPQVELPPHVYAVASSAHLGMMQNSKSQSVIISGESGAGKTETAKILLKYLAEVACPGATCTTACCCRRTRSWRTSATPRPCGTTTRRASASSSRCSSTVSGRMQGAFMKTYLLEKSRIVNQLSGEQNYHVLYQVAPASYGRAREASTTSTRGTTYDYLNVKGARRRRVERPADDFATSSRGVRGDPRAPARRREVLARARRRPPPRQRSRFAGKGEDDASFTKATTARVDPARGGACSAAHGRGAALEGDSLAEHQGGPRLDREAELGRARVCEGRAPRRRCAHTRGDDGDALLAPSPARHTPRTSIPRAGLLDARSLRRGRRLALLHRRRRHLRLRVLPDQLARAALHQLRQREAAAHVHRGRLRVGRLAEYARVEGIDVGSDDASRTTRPSSACSSRGRRSGC